VATDAPTATARLLRQRLGGEVWLPVDGHSMRPTIVAPGQVRVVARTRPRIGEVWAFVGDGGRIVGHRCQWHRPEGYVFHGDARAVADPVVAPERLIGRAVAVRDGRGERRLGVLDRVRGLARQGARQGRRVTERAARWAFSLISRRARSR
jgi:hypothetical protein